MANERELAAYYREHKDDPDLWGEGEGPDVPRERKKLSATITVRFSPDEANLIRQVAQSKGLSYSDVVRAAVREYTQPRLSVESGVMTQFYGWTKQHLGQAGEVTLGGDLQKATEPRIHSLAAR